MREVDILYVSISLFMFAISLLGVFVPIFLYDQGISLSTVYLFYILYFGTYTFLAIPIGKLIPVIGVKNFMLARIPLEVIFLVYLLNFNPQSLLFMAVVWGAGLAVYWHALNADFFCNSKKGRKYTEAAILMAIPSVAKAVAPVIGGVILTIIHGYNPLFAVALLFIILSALPLILTGEKKLVFHLEPNQENLKTGAYFIFQGFTGVVEYIFWPFWVYYNGSVLSAGLALSFSLIGLAVVRLMVGKFSDYHGWRIPMFVGMLFYTVVWGLRSMITTPLGLFILSFAGGLSTAFIYTPAFGLLSTLATRKTASGHSILRALTMGIGRLTCLGILFLAQLNYPFVFVIMGLASFFMMFYTFIY